METKRVKVQSLDNSTNVAAQISRIQMDRDKIRAKLVELSLAESTDNLDLLANQRMSSWLLLVTEISIGVDLSTLVTEPDGFETLLTLEQGSAQYS